MIIICPCSQKNKSTSLNSFVKQMNWSDDLRVLTQPELQADYQQQANLKPAAITFFNCLYFSALYLFIPQEEFDVNILIRALFLPFTKFVIFENGTDEFSILPLLRFSTWKFILKKIPEAKSLILFKVMLPFALALPITLCRIVWFRIKWELRRQK